MPAVVVGSQGHGAVAKFRLPGQFSLRNVGHADDIHTPGAVQVGLGTGGELGPLHTDVGAPLVNPGPRGLSSPGDNIGQGMTHGICEGYVADDPAAEKGGCSPFGSVDELMGHDKIPRYDLLLHAANRRYRYNCVHTEGFQGPDVGPVIDLRRCYSVPFAVPGKESHLHIVQGACDDAVGRFTEGR